MDLKKAFHSHIFAPFLLSYPSKDTSFALSHLGPAQLVRSKFDTFKLLIGFF